jgi:hypothetical protein
MLITPMTCYWGEGASGLSLCPVGEMATEAAVAPESTRAGLPAEPDHEFGMEALQTQAVGHLDEVETQHVATVVGHALILMLIGAFA